MERQIGRITITNTFPRPTMLAIEPWGRDFWMDTNETFEVVAMAEEMDPDFYFGIAYGELQIQIWAEGNCLDMVVMHNGQELRCGHNRPVHFMR